MNGGLGQPLGLVSLPSSTICLHLKNSDDMTNAGQVVTMHAVPRTAFLVVDSCLSSSIG